MRVTFVEISSCCETIDELDTNKSLVISILEQIISEESNIREKHIEKLRNENEISNEEAVQREEELVQIIKQQEITIQQSEQKIGEMEKLIETLMNKKTTKTTCTQTEIENREQNLQTEPNTSDCSMQTYSPMTKDESITMSGLEQSLDDETNRSNEHLHYSIKKCMKEELRLSVNYIIEKISQTATKIDVLKDSNIDLVSLLTNKDNLIRDISHLCYNKPRIPTQQTISNEECMMTKKKTLGRNRSQTNCFFVTTHNTKTHSLSRHEDNGKDLSPLVQTCGHKKRAIINQEDNMKKKITTWFNSS
ncbi:hypothetical protein JTB14_017159 [Gonioctena quinquepunctata]|nr:hypothetical protein JTB14_017159 [Gonioctena quinquepunctata]